MDHQRSSADQLRSSQGALECMFNETGSDASAGPSPIRGELSEKQAWNGVRRLTSSNRSGQDGWHHGRRGEAIEADHSFCLVNDKYCGEALRLIGKRARLEPMIERRLAAIEIGELMPLVERFRLR